MQSDAGTTWVWRRTDLSTNQQGQTKISTTTVSQAREIKSQTPNVQFACCENCLFAHEQTLPQPIRTPRKRKKQCGEPSKASHGTSGPSPSKKPALETSLDEETPNSIDLTSSSDSESESEVIEIF